jgi:hypothetical protein
MQLLTIFLVGCIFLFNSVISDDEIELPVKTCRDALFSKDFAACTNEIAKTIYDLHRWSAKNTPHTRCGLPCTTNVKGRLSRWKWVWDGQFRCDSKAPGIVGEATKLSKDGAIEWAIKDFLTRAIKAGHIKPEEFKC